MNIPPLPPMAELLDVLFRIALPAAIPAALLPCLTARRWGDQGAVIGPVLGVGLGLLAANFFRYPLPWIPGRWGWSWFLLAWLAVLLGGWLTRIHPRARWAGAMVATGTASLVLLPGDLRVDPGNFIWLALAAGAPWIGSILSEGNSKTPRAGRVPDELLLMSIALLGGSVVLIHAHSARLMDLALMAASALVGSACAAAILRVNGSPLWGVPFITLPGLMLIGWSETSSEVPTASFALAGLAAWPLVGFRKRNLSPTIRLVRGGMVLAPGALSVILAMRAETLAF